MTVLVFCNTSKIVISQGAVLCACCAVEKSVAIRGSTVWIKGNTQMTLLHHENQILSKIVPPHWRGVSLACGRGCRVASVIRACPRSTPKWVYLVWYVVCCPYFHRCLCCGTKSLIPAFPGRHKALVVHNFLWWMRGRKGAVLPSTLGSIPLQNIRLQNPTSLFAFINHLGFNSIAGLGWLESLFGMYWHHLFDAVPCSFCQIQ